MHENYSQEIGRNLKVVFDGTNIRLGLNPGCVRSGIFIVASALLEEMCRRSELEMAVYSAPEAVDEDLSPLYSGARAFAHMGIYEGFGLPPLEAMQRGVPVLSSNTSSLPEVVGDAALTVPPDDLDGAVDAMTRLASGRCLLRLVAAKRQCPGEALQRGSRGGDHCQCHCT